MAYLRPSGLKVELDFDGLGFTRPSGLKVELNFSEGGAPPGDDQYVFPTSWDASSIGAPLVTGVRITPNGWQSSAFSTPTIANLAKAAYPGGIAPPPSTGTNEFRQIPSPWVSFWVRYLDLNSPTSRGIAPPAWTNTHVIGYEIRVIDHAGRGSSTMVFGTPRVEFSSRTVYPNFISSMVLGTPNVARIQVIAPSGLASTNAFGSHQLDINLQRLFPTGPSTASYGEPVVRNQHEYLRPQGIAPVGVGFPVVYNLDQYVNVIAFEGNGDPTTWPLYYPFVENKIRELRPSGWQSSRFSVIGNVVANGARALYPEGWDSFTWGSGGFIAHYTRYLGAEGWDSFYNTHYHVVYNNARLVRPTGWDSAAFGTPDPVLNLNRTVKHHSGPSDGYYGTPFVAFAIRRVYPGLFYDVPSAYPEVRLNPYPIKPAGIAIPPTTAPWVYEHFNILGPPSVNVHAVPWVGEPFVQNRNKTLYPYQSDQALYGRPTIFNYNTHITISAGDQSRYGAHLISYRTRAVTVAPISLPVFTVLHQIRNDLPDPPGQQLILPASLNVNGNGTVGIVPQPTLILRAILPNGITEWAIPAPVVRGNGIFPTSLVTPDNVGIPAMIGTQYAYPTSIPRSVPIIPGQPEPEVYGDSDDYWTKNHNLGYEWPRLSPHTVYAPQGSQATSQAVMNNPPYPEPTYHTIDGNMAAGYANSRNPFFGNTWISLKHRIIGPVPNQSPGSWNQLDPSSVVSDGAVVDLRVRYVYPEGIRSMRFGRVVFWGVPQFIYLMDNEGGIAPPAISLTHDIGFPEQLNRYIYPQGIAGAFGATRIELFNREVSPQGIPHRGNPQEGFTNPWGTALVGYPREYEWGGYDFTLWGDAWFSHYTREVYPEGWNSLSLENDFIGEFDARMRVRLVSHSRTISAVGQILSGVVGQALVEFSNRTVQARPVYPGPVGDHRVVSVIAPTGWDSLEVGNIDEWEAGKIKAHGDDLSAVGYPRMGRILSPLSFDSMEFGNTRFARPIYVAGMPEIGFDGPALTNPFGCMNRVVVTSPIISTQAVPAPAVAHE